MNVYISVDMEGIAGVAHEDQTDPISPRNATDYADARRLMTEEASAAVAGAVTAGANRIVVNDSHWHMRNILPELLHPAAELGTGSPKPFSMVDGIDDGFDALVFIGYHAKAGTARAAIDHTYNDTIHDVHLNGVSVGEVGLNAALAGWHGVPLVLVSGDQAVAAETTSLLGPHVETVIVKQSLGRQSVVSLHPTVARRRIEDGVRSALSRPHLPWTVEMPCELRVDFVRTSHADNAELVPGSVRTGARSMTYRHESMPEIFRAWRALYNLATVP